MTSVNMLWSLNYDSAGPSFDLPASIPPGYRIVKSLLSSARRHADIMDSELVVPSSQSSMKKCSTFKICQLAHVPILLYVRRLRFTYIRFCLSTSAQEVGNVGGRAAPALETTKEEYTLRQGGKGVYIPGTLHFCRNVGRKSS